MDTENIYKGAKEHLDAYIELIGIANKAKNDDVQELCQKLNTKLEEITIKTKNSKEAGIKLPLARFCELYKFSMDECLTFVYVVYKTLIDRSPDQQDIASFLEKFDLMNKSKLLDVCAMFSTGGKFFKANIIKKEVRHFIASDEIINFTTNTKNSSENKVKSAKKKLVPFSKMLSPKEIYETLNQHIIGQESAKRMLSVAVANHMHKIDMHCKGQKMLGKSNVVLFGPTGCGKTYFCKIIAELLQVPFVTVDATTYTETGYVGECVDDMIKKLYDHAKKDKQKTEFGIIYIDEIDKIAERNPGGNHKAGYKDVSGKSVQEELLKLIEGTTLTINISPFMGRSASINTENILFIVGGAFSGLSQIVSKRLSGSGVCKKKEENFERKPLGFLSVTQDVKDSNLAADGNDYTVLKKAHASDFVSYGMMPELMGRLPMRVPLGELSENDLADVLTKPKYSIFEEYSALIKQYNAGEGITLNQDMVSYIAKEAYKRGLGARGLRAVMEELMSPVVFDLSMNGHTGKSVEITEEVLKRNIALA